MKPAPVGTRIRVISNTFNHAYAVGGVYTVKYIDDDGTFRAVDDLGHVGNWLRWIECALAGPSMWDKLAADLPEPLVRFLACFDEISHITLKQTVIDAVLAKVPDLHERIVAVANTPIGEAAIARNMPQRSKKRDQKPVEQA
jgi:hypothetical protein